MSLFGSRSFRYVGTYRCGCGRPLDQERRRLGTCAVCQLASLALGEPIVAPGAAPIRPDPLAWLRHRQEVA
jgi:hypothetical protein